MIINISIEIDDEGETVFNKNVNVQNYFSYVRKKKYIREVSWIMLEIELIIIQSFEKLELINSNAFFLSL